MEVQKSKTSITDAKGQHFENFGFYRNTNDFNSENNFKLS